MNSTYTEEFKQGARIALIEAAYTVKYFGEDGTWEEDMETWNAMYEAGVGEAVRILREYPDRKEALGCLYCEIECEDLLEDSRIEAYNLCRSIIAGGIQINCITGEE